MDIERLAVTSVIKSFQNAASWMHWTVVMAFFSEEGRQDDFMDDVENDEEIYYIEIKLLWRLLWYGKQWSRLKLI